MRGAIRFLLENSIFFLAGALAGLVWANLDPESHAHLLHASLLENPWFGEPHGETRIITVHFLVNDILMALFFAIAGKEVREAMLPGGPLSDPRRAATPLVAAVGGMAGPALLYLAAASAFGLMDEIGNGWAVPTATDIAFSYVVARLVFGGDHPAIPFLLLLAIADDAMGLVILAVFYPQKPVEPVWLLLVVGAVVAGLLLRRFRVASFWPYLLGPGVVSWIGFAHSGLHPALGLLPVIAVMPHAKVDTGLFDWSAMDRDDTLNAFEHWWSNPVEFILAAFGLLNAGVVLSAAGEPTWIVLGALLVGKPLGIFLTGMFSAKVLGFGLPEGLTPRELFVVGCAAGIGFTVALFVATVAFPPGEVQDAAKMGALASFAAAIVTWVAAKALGVRRRTV
jgi:NhaA family Na+:H+ antiporter